MKLACPKRQLECTIKIQEINYSIIGIPASITNYLRTILIK
jgi:hypothetical protein